MRWHIREGGASFREVLEAVEVAIEMGGGPATVSARFALEVMDRAFGRELTGSRAPPAGRSGP